MCSRQSFVRPQSASLNPRNLPFVSNRALQLDADNAECLHLLALLLSAQGRFPEALVVCESILHEHPLDVTVMITAAHVVSRFGMS